MARHRPGHDGRADHVALAVYDADPTTYWVATASGGLLKTVNNGISFEHQFDREATVSIGAVAVAPSDKNIVWVGTGEANPRNSVSYGDGVYKSTDGGKTWKNMGLKTSFQIGSIVVHPKNAGHRLCRRARPAVRCRWRARAVQDRGRRQDLEERPDRARRQDRRDRHRHEPDESGNATGRHVGTAARRVRQLPRRRYRQGPGGTDEYAPTKVHGAGGAIYKTTDGGKSFTKLVKGLPTVKLGRIGLDWSRKSPQTAFAILDSEQAGMGKPPARVYLGIQGEDVSGGGGAKLTSITPQQPAAQAGLKEGDVIIAIDGTSIKNYEGMLDEFRKKQPGDKAKFTVQRGKDKTDIEVTYGRRPDDRPSPGFTPEQAEGGLRVAELVENGPAEKAGLKVGDVVTAIDDTPVKTRREAFDALGTKKVGDKIKVAYTRGADKKTVEVELASSATSGRPYSQPPLGGQQANVQNQQGPDGFQTGGLYKSTDGGDTWTRINSINPRPFYFSVVRVDPTDDNILWILGVNLARSTDGGKTFSEQGINGGLHSDQHALWINPKDGRHLVIGTDGGFYVSYDKAARWDHMHHAGAIGQFYHVAVDNRMPYRAYGGLQDNGSWGGPSRSERFRGPINQDWQNVAWGDGFVCRVDPIDPDIVYAESQDGNMLRRNLRTGGSVRIGPRARTGLERFRWNWNTPFILSAHNSSIFYAAGNYVFRSLKQGDDLQAVSPRSAAPSAALAPPCPSRRGTRTNSGPAPTTGPSGSRGTVAKPGRT